MLILLISIFLLLKIQYELLKKIDFTHFSKEENKQAVENRRNTNLDGRRNPYGAL